jgi:hypothetical protein
MFMLKRLSISSARNPLRDLAWVTIMDLVVGHRAGMRVCRWP